ncbi:MAG: alkaline phosphatase family protein [Acidobacteriota bacterium]
MKQVKINLRYCAFAFILLFCFVGCKQNELTGSGQTIIFGLDGAGWNVLNPLLEKGSLPNFNRLIDGGSWGVLETIEPTKSSIIWTSIATGKSMIKHGIVDWTYINENNIQVPYSHSERRAKTFWNIYGDLGYEVGVINWFITYPPEEVEGYMISEEFKKIYKYDLNETPVTYPEVLLKKLMPFRKTLKDFREIIKENNLPDFRKEAKNSRKGSLIRTYNIFVTQEKIIEDISLFLFKRWPTDIYATYFRLIDIVSHFASGLIDPELLEQAKKEEEQNGAVSEETMSLIDRNLAFILEPFFIYYDGILEHYLQSMNENDIIILVSDHSFVFENGGYGHTNMKNTPHGIIIMKGPYIKENYIIEVAHIYDVLPTMLYLYDLPVGKDMDGRILVEALEEALLEKRKIRTIDSYDSNKLLEKKRKRDEKIDKSILEELRTLGYIK